jgi:predicted restriction endonuclease
MALRQGGPEFRKNLLVAYGRHCAITRCDCEDGLDAAHIRLYRGEHTNYVDNGILLRSNIHTLFDIGKLAIDPITLKIILHQSLKATVYGKLEGQKFRPPSNPKYGPNKVALKKHLAESGLKAPRGH